MTNNTPSPRRALVLGCGGVAGGAWSIAALHHLEQKLDWDARDAETSPLWIRAEALEHLNPLRSHPNALLIVSGLRNACLPPRRRSTPRRQGAYREAMSIIESLAAQHPNAKRWCLPPKDTLWRWSRAEPRWV